MIRLFDDRYEDEITNSQGLIKDYYSMMIEPLEMRDALNLLSNRS